MRRSEGKARARASSGVVASRDRVSCGMNPWIGSMRARRARRQDTHRPPVSLFLLIMICRVSGSSPRNSIVLVPGSLARYTTPHAPAAPATKRPPRYTPTRPRPSARTSYHTHCIFRLLSDTFLVALSLPCPVPLSFVVDAGEIQVCLPPLIDRAGKHRGAWSEATQTSGNGATAERGRRGQRRSARGHRCMRGGRLRPRCEVAPSVEGDFFARERGGVLVPRPDPRYATSTRPSTRLARGVTQD